MQGHGPGREGEQILELPGCRCALDLRCDVVVSRQSSIDGWRMNVGRSLRERRQLAERVDYTRTRPSKIDDPVGVKEAMPGCREGFKPRRGEAEAAPKVGLAAVDQGREKRLVSVLCQQVHIKVDPWKSTVLRRPNCQDPDSSSSFQLFRRWQKWKPCSWS